LIKKVAPNAEILFVPSHHDVFFVGEAFGSGARGFLSKDHMAAEPICAVRQVYSRRKFVGKNLRAVPGVPAGEAAL
jgi:DNA-binding NarL/FixJ family response regulator